MSTVLGSAPRPLCIAVGAHTISIRNTANTFSVVCAQEKLMFPIKQYCMLAILSISHVSRILSQGINLHTSQSLIVVHRRSSTWNGAGHLQQEGTHREGSNQFHHSMIQFSRHSILSQLWLERMRYWCPVEHLQLQMRPCTDNKRLQTYFWWQAHTICSLKTVPYNQFNCSLK